MREPIHEIYTDGVTVLMLKEAYTVVFAEGPYEALVELDMFEHFAEMLFDSDLKKAEMDLKGANAMCIQFHSKNMLVMILPFNVKPGVIAHESFHMTRMICDRKGIYLSDDSEEVYAHLLDWIVENATKTKRLVAKLRREEKKKKK